MTPPRFAPPPTKHVREIARRRRERRVRVRYVRLDWRDHLAYWRARYLP